MAAKIIRLTHKITIQLHLVAESCTICSFSSRWPIRKLLDIPSYIQTTPLEFPIIFGSVKALRGCAVQYKIEVWVDGTHSAVAYKGIQSSIPRYRQLQNGKWMGYSPSGSTITLQWPYTSISVTSGLISGPTLNFAFLFLIQNSLTLPPPTSTL
jgi:hypothetical protein